MTSIEKTATNRFFWNTTKNNQRGNGTQQEKEKRPKQKNKVTNTVTHNIKKYIEADEKN